MVARTLTACVLLLLPAAVFAADPLVPRSSEREDRDRAARAALALASSSARPAATTPALAPAPRYAKPATYADGHKRAVIEQRPLVVFVSCPSRPVPGADVCETTATTFGNITGPAVVVCVPQGDRLTVDSSHPCPVGAEKVKAAVDDAAKKMGSPGPPKSMPAAPKPLDWQLRDARSGYLPDIALVSADADCPCGLDCACDVGKACVCGAYCSCPACPTKPTAGARGGSFVPDPFYRDLPTGYAWQATANGHGIAGPGGAWYVEPSPVHTERLNAGYWYVPMPEANNWPRGYWVSPCWKDADCKVTSCDVRPVGQHGLPTTPGVAESMGNAFHPNASPYGQRRVITGCDRNACPLPVSGAVSGPSVPQAAAPQIVGYQYQQQCVGGVCRMVAVPVYGQAAATPGVVAQRPFSSSPVASAPSDGSDALAEVNAKRASRGLRPYQFDAGLTQAARACAQHRADRLMFGHVMGGMGDFQFVPPGTRCDATGCAAYPPSMGFLACAVYDNYRYAGAATVIGRDGRAYHSLFVRH